MKQSKVTLPESGIYAGNCYMNGVRCKHLLCYYPWCRKHRIVYSKESKSEPTVRAIGDSNVCGDYENSEI